MGLEHIFLNLNDLSCYFIENYVRNQRNDAYVWLKVINIQEILYYDYRFFMAPTMA